MPQRGRRYKIGSVSFPSTDLNPPLAFEFLHFCISVQFPPWFISTPTPIPAKSFPPQIMQLLLSPLSLLLLALPILASPCAPSTQPQSPSPLKSTLPFRPDNFRVPAIPQGETYQATITGYGGACDTKFGSCGILASKGAYTGAISVGWNVAGKPGQCGICFRLSGGYNMRGGGVRNAPITTPPIVVMITNTCAPNHDIPGFQCNQNAAAPRDRFGSVTVLDLCHDTGAADAYWGRGSLHGGGTGGLAVANITRVTCDGWQGGGLNVAHWASFKVKANGKGVDPR